MNESPQSHQNQASNKAGVGQLTLSVIGTFVTTLSCYIAYLALKGDEEDRARRFVSGQGSEIIKYKNNDQYNAVSPGQNIEQAGGAVPQSGDYTASPQDNHQESLRNLPKPAATLASTPAPTFESRGCPARTIVLRFTKPGNVSSRFEAVGDPTHVRMVLCEGDGSFVTRFPADLGSIDDTGIWSDERIQFDFGYTSSFADDRPVKCSVSGKATGTRLYGGSLACHDDDDHSLLVNEVVIEL